MTVADISAPPTFTDPVVAQFREYAAQTMSDYDGPMAADRIAEMFAQHLTQHRAQISGLSADVRESAGQASVARALLEHTAAAVSREVAAGAEWCAQANRARHIDKQLLALESDLRAEGLTDTADRLGAAMSYPLIDTPSYVPPHAVAFIPDQRWRVGWFNTPNGAQRTAYPFAGWQLLHDPGHIAARQPEASFLVLGRMWALSELETRGYTLAHMD
ncbi:hypothetical protein ACFRCW_42445 [Streptomyces sp. NPDC056653]|uniref:hypothetical protein n=1 Tax=Streptomyces sp. NPDC056653 TaxID=3345894 RepID=UPI00367BB0B8